MTHEYLVVTTTTASRDEARRIAEQLLQRRQAACIQIEGPIESHYRWQGNIEFQQEWRLVIKTVAEAFEALQATVRELHSYEQPQLIAVPIVVGDPGYLQWVRESIDDSAS